MPNTIFFFKSEVGHFASITISTTEPKKNKMPDRLKNCVVSNTNNTGNQDFKTDLNGSLIHTK